MDSPLKDLGDSVPETSSLDSYANKSHLVTVARAFFDEIERRYDRVDPVRLGGPIELSEWWSARATQPAIVDRWFYEDVGCFIAPGGTGKTTLLLFQIIHIVLGRELFGHDVRNTGPVVLLTAEDSRETLIARLRYMCTAMGLTEAETANVREDVIITDLSGRGIKLTSVEKDVVVPSRVLDRLIVEMGVRNPSLIVVDPMVSFGVGEARVNDAEQGMIDAGRRIRNAIGCGVLFVHHTGKENARSRTTDQYSGRGGSALADGSRMVHVLQRLTPEEWTAATGDFLVTEESGFILSRPKMTWCPPQPDAYIKRRGYLFERFAPIEPSEGASAVVRACAEKLHLFLKEELLKGTRHTGRTVESAKLMPQKATRDALQRLIADGRLVSEPMPGGGRGGARTFLRPVDLPSPS